jgi:transcriptional antiterminator RfaH
MMCTSTWFVVQTQPRAEMKARRHLINQGFTVYLPVYRRRLRHARRNTIAMRPLFPGYLFVHLDPAQQRWRSINGTIGVRQILSGGDAPRFVPDRIIDEIRAREDESGAVKLLPPTFSPGQAVRLVDGPLADVSGLFEEVRDESRIVLLLSLLGRQVRVVAPAAQITAAA